MSDETELRRKLDDTEQHIFRVKQLLRRLETKRDRLNSTLSQKTPESDSHARIGTAT